MYFLLTIIGIKLQNSSLANLLFMFNFYDIKHFIAENTTKWWFIVIIITLLTFVFFYVIIKMKNYNNDLSIKYYEDKITYKQVRIYLIFFGVLFPLMEFLLEFYKTRPQSAIILNCSIGAALLILYFYGYKSKLIKNNFRLLLRSLFCAFTILKFYNFYVNPAFLMSVSELMLMLIFAPNVFVKIKQYWTFLVIFGLILLAFYQFEVMSLQIFLIMIHYSTYIIIIHYIRHIAILNTQDKFIFANEIVNNGNSLIIGTNKNGELLYCNESITSILGYAREDALGLGFWTLTKDQEFIGAAYHNDYIDNKLYVRRLQCADGSFKFIQWKDRKITENLYVGIGQDITNEYIIQRKYRDLVENAKDFIFELDLDGNFIYLNNFTYQKFQLQASEVINFHYAKFLRPDYVQKVLNFYKSNVTVLNEFPAIEFPVISKIGSEMWVSQKVYLRKDENGHIEGFSGIARDITVLKNIEIQNQKRSEKTTKFGKSINELNYTNFNVFESKKEILAQILKQTAEILNTNRISYWKYKSDVLTCKILLQDFEIIKAAENLTKIDFPIYFETIKNFTNIAANDVFQEEQFSEFQSTYFNENNIKSMLDIPIYLNGKISGMLRIENQNKSKEWDVDDIGFAKNITDIITVALTSKTKEITEKELKYKSELLSAIAHCTEKFLLSKNFEDIFTESFKIVGNALNCDHIIYHEYQQKNDSISQKFKWAREGITMQVGEIPSFNSKILDGAIEGMRIKKYFKSITTQLPAGSIRSVLEYNQIKSILIYPLYFQENLLGFIGFDDCTTEKKWTKDEIQILKTFANNISFAIERKNKENEIYESEEKFRLLANNMPGTVYLSNVDEKWTKIYLNDEILNLTGYSKNAFMNREIDYIDLIHPEDAKYVEKTMRTAIKFKKPFNFKYRIYNKNKEIVWIEEFGDSIYKNDKIQYVEGIFIDISASIIAENAVKAKKIAESSNKAKSEFLANMSHEIRTPLNGIIGFTELLMCSKLDYSQEKYLLTVQQSATSLLEIVNDILDFSKIEANKLNIFESKHNIIILLNQITDLIAIEASKKNIDLKLFLAADVPTFVWMDNMRIKQILLNLLSNAVKFTSKGTVSVEINVLEFLKKDYARLRFSVKDTGIGIKKENQHRVFRAFSQEDNSTTRKFGGTGLGLTISNQLLGMMKSELKLDSEENQGSHFYFDIDVKISNEDKKAENTQIPALKKQTEEAKKDSKIKLLLVEDNLINMLLLKTIIQNFSPNIKILEANDGFQAIEKFELYAPDLIFMDIQMPNMNGYIATQNIRKMQFGHIPKIIAISAGVMGDEKAICIQNGMDDYFSKPISKEVIIKILADFITEKNIKE